MNNNKNALKTLAVLGVMMIVLTCNSLSIAINIPSVNMALSNSTAENMPFGHDTTPTNEDAFLDPFAREAYYNHTEHLLEIIPKESITTSSLRGSMENVSQPTIKESLNKNTSRTVTTLSSNTSYVPEDYATIQWAIDNATAGDTIIVHSGTYYEHVNVTKRLPCGAWIRAVARLWWTLVVAVMVSK